MPRLVLATAAVALGLLAATSSASAGVNDVKRLATKFERVGYECEIKPAVANFREANCYQGSTYVHMVAFSGKSAYRAWLPLWCDLGTGEPFISNRRSWIVDSTDVSLKDLRKVIKGKRTNPC